MTTTNLNIEHTSFDIQILREQVDSNLKRGWAGVSASASLRYGAGGPVQADYTSIFLGGKVNVCRCHEFWSNSKNKVRCCVNFSVKF